MAKIYNNINIDGTLAVAGAVTFSDNLSMDGYNITNIRNGSGSSPSIRFTGSGDGLDGLWYDATTARIIIGLDGYTTGLFTVDSNGFSFYPEGSEKIRINATGMGFSTVAPTHPITLSSTAAANGIVLYNTTDQTTNYERFAIRWTGSILKIQTEKAAGGVARVIDILNGSSTGVRFNTATLNLLGNASNQHTIAPSDASVQLNLRGSFSNSSGTCVLLGSTGSFGASSGSQMFATVSGTVAQSGTAGYEALVIAITENSLGSGTNRLLDATVGGAQRFYFDNTGKLVVGSTADTTTHKLVVDGYIGGPTYSDSFLHISKSGDADATHVFLRSNTDLVLGSAHDFIHPLVVKQNGQVVIGTNVVTTDAQLDLARTDGALLLPRLSTTQRDALTASNGMLIYNTTGNEFQGYDAGVWSQLVYTSNGITTITGNLTVNGQAYSSLPATLTPSGTTQTIDWDDGNAQVLSLASATGNVTVTLSNPVAGASYIIKVIQHASAAKDIVWPASVEWPDGITPVITTVLSAVDVVSLFFDGSVYYSNIGQNYS